MDLLSFSSADMGELLPLEGPQRASPCCRGLTCHTQELDQLTTFSSPVKDYGWMDCHDDTVTSLLLQEIEFLTQSSVGADPSATHSGHTTTTTATTTTSSSPTTATIREQTTVAQSPWPNPDPTDPMFSSEPPLCDDLLDTFDLLCYTESGAGDPCGQVTPSAERWLGGPGESAGAQPPWAEWGGVGEDQQPWEDARFTRLKPRGKDWVGESCGHPDRDAVGGRCGEAHDDKMASSPLFRPSRREANEPRRPKNGFMRFSVKHRAELSRRHPNKDNRTISKLLGARWKRMSSEEKRPYEEEFSMDIHKIRTQNPKWRYAPARQSVDDLVEPMHSRLRPRDKIRSKLLRQSEWECTWSPPNDASQQLDACHGRQSPLQHSATSWIQCHVCRHWRPLPGHVDAKDLPPFWCCSMNPDQQFNKCGIPLQVPSLTCPTHLLPPQLVRPGPAPPQTGLAPPHPQTGLVPPPPQTGLVPPPPQTGLALPPALNPPSMELLNASVSPPEPASQTVSLLTPEPASQTVSLLTPEPARQTVSLLTPEPASQTVSLLTPKPASQTVSLQVSAVSQPPNPSPLLSVGAVQPAPGGHAVATLPSGSVVASRRSPQPQLVTPASVHPAPGSRSAPLLSPVVSQPVVSQPVVSQPVVSQPVVTPGLLSQLLTVPLTEPALTHQRLASRGLPYHRPPHPHLVTASLHQSAPGNPRATRVSRSLTSPSHSPVLLLWSV